MSKYGDLIKEARKTENPIIKKNETDIVRKQETEHSSILANKKSSIPEIKKSSIPEIKEEEKLAGISIKVPENLRRHWVVESKRKGKSMTSVIIEALAKEFGEP